MTKDPPSFLPDGVFSRARLLSSPNYDDRPLNEPVVLLVIHNISLPPGEFGGGGVIDLFLNRLDHRAHPYFAQLQGLRVSSHFFIRRAGELIQFVPCDRRAWHAGLSRWRGRERCNDFSIGVELEGTDHEAFTDAQYESLGLLARELRLHYPIVESVGHCDIAPGRKTDPGPHFDWNRFRHDV